MGLREVLQKHRGVAVGLAILAMAGAGWVILSETKGSSDVKTVFYTNDDGKTFFEDSVDRVPPFDKDGKPAYGAMVMECRGVRQVCYMTRFSEQSKALVESARTSGEMAKGKFDWSKVAREYKRPGDAVWITAKPETFGQITQIQTPKCPDGSKAELIMP